MNRLEANLAIQAAQTETLYQIALLERMHPSLVEKILRLPPRFADHLSSADPRALERNLAASKALHRGKVHLLMDIAGASKQLPVQSRAVLYREALQQADPSSRELAARNLAELLYTHGLDDASLLHLLDETLAVAGDSRTLRTRQAMSLMRIALLALRGETAAALPLLESYLSLHKGEGLFRFPPVAWLAYEQGFRAGANFLNAAFVYGHMRKNQEKDLFRAWLQGKSIALVGNGPQELGRGRGGEIDAHDVVVRINHAVVNDKYSADYGTKTDVWCKNGLTPHVYGDFDAARYLLLPNNCERYPAPAQQNAALARTIRKQGRVLVAPARREMQALMRALGVEYCSVGLLTAALLRRLAPAFSAGDIYGMSFAGDGPDSYHKLSRLYYFDEISIPHDAYETHALDRERAGFERFFG